ncbi:MFS transporter [Corynebacterium uropygiale]|uniref:MFS transporter n=1 Tax=Corynebacterium uropygiale TaxID=1775911 RepID=A0A9X1QS22_9CORY|nr:MFS transporter [Corynebacterium uropygiale]MCF4007135.1 MFS transporter [Corynebacterium uropygiale]
MSPDTTSTQRWTFLAIISVGLFLIGADNSVLYTALPTLEADLGTSALEALWVINAYPLVLCGLLLGTGTLGDRIGHRLMFLLGVTIFGLASLGAALAPSAWALILARATLGVGAAMMLPSTLALISITFDDEQERNTAIGIWGSMGAVGAATGPLLGGLLLNHFWWGSVFLINVPVAVAVWLATVIIAPANAPNPERHWDALSSFYAMLAMMGAVMLIKEAAAGREPWLLGASAACMILGGWLFQRRQRRLPSPLLTFDIFINRLFSGGVLAAGGAMFCVSGMEYMTTQRFQLIGGYTPLESGLLVALVSLACIPASILGGIYLARLGFRTLIAGGFALLAVGLVVAAVAFSRGQLLAFAVGLLLVGVGAGSVMSVSSTAIIGSAPLRRAGMASSVESVSYEFGTLVAVAIVGSAMPALYRLFAPAGRPELLAADPASAAAYDSGYFCIVGIVAAMAALCALVTAWCFRGNPRRALVPEGVH